MQKFANHDGYTVLVVDDEPAGRYVLSRQLDAAGFRTMQAGAGAEALELAEFASAVVLDVQLPDLHGFEVCRLMRARFPALPIIHVSAVHVSELDKASAALAGADAYLVAPVDPELLVARLDALLAVPGSR